MRRVRINTTTWLCFFVLLALVLVTACSDEDGGSTSAGNGNGAGTNGTNGGEGGPDNFGVLANASIEVSPKAIVFDAWTQAERIVTVKNVGDKGNLTLLSVGLKVGSSPEFTVSQPEATLLPPLGFTTFVVKFTPGQPSPTGTVVINHNGLDGGPVHVPLSVSTTGGSIVVIPGSLDFGDVAVGQPKKLTTVINNIGTEPVEIVGIELTDTTPDDFQVLSTPVPFQIGPGDTNSVDVSYLPDGKGTDLGELRIVANLESGGEVIVPLLGNVIGPKLLAIPAIVDFGVVDINSKKTISVELKNAGSATLTISEVYPSAGTVESVSVVDLPDLPVSVDPGASVSVNAVFRPDVALPVGLNALGGVAVASNDPGLPLMVVPIYGSVATADLLVSPDFVDFGIVATGDVVTRQVHLLNKGKQALEIKSVDFVDDHNGEFSLVGWSPSGFSPPGILAADEAAIMTLAFTNKGGTNLIVTGSMSITSTDTDQSSQVLPLEAKRGGSKKCEIELVPGALNYGIVPHGHTKTMPMTIKNVGTGPCTFVSATTYDCASFLGIPGACSTGIGNSAKNFKIIAQPPPVPGGIPQGGKANIMVMFVPPENAPIIEFFDTYNGAIQVLVSDPSNGGAQIAAPPGQAPSQILSNLTAKSGISDISVIPGNIDFGLTTIGCTSPETKVTIYNNGNAPLVIEDIKLIDCTPEFSITQIPPIPPAGIEVTQTKPVEVWVLYKPQISGKSYCTLAVTSSDTDQPLLTVPLEGKGTFDTENTDEFVQLSGKDVDILFVIDDSGSMGEEQSNLADNFKSLIKEAATWNSNYQIGVITTDAGSPNKSGKLQGSPLFVIPSPNAQSQFEKNAKVGENGSGSEAGLEAAHLALTLPLIHTTSTACSSDNDCTAPDKCVVGTCGGHNAGFLRKEAALEVVFVSDEEDQSPAPVSFYVDFLKSIKGFANDNLMHAHAIVGDSPGGCTSSDGSADAGKRYIEVATQTGGKVASICDSSFAAALSTIGNVAFGLKEQFFLSAVAQPGTVKVWVDDFECAGGWFYDIPSNSVIFDDMGVCMPQEGQKIKIYYKMLCLQEG